MRGKAQLNLKVSRSRSDAWPCSDGECSCAHRLELREMINQEMIANPVLEELSEDPHSPITTATNLPRRNRKCSGEAGAIPLTNSRRHLIQSIPGFRRRRWPIAGARSFRAARRREVLLLRHRPDRSSAWQLSVTICSDACASWPRASSATWMRTVT